ncbi:MAG: SDR family NAD(P)-dependent oxidoreductase [Pseudomonadota bacterium]|nr:SDR family NAD(P)-dependent oxidoreductase [Pseudomonadota bacterium]
MGFFSDKKIVITGAASGIGKSLAIKFATEGADLILCDTKQAKLKQTQNILVENGAVCDCYSIDVKSYSSMVDFAEQVTNSHGDIDILINNAGVSLMDKMTDADLDDFRWLMEINFWGVVHGVKAFLPSLLRKEKAHIVNISSILGLMSMPGQAAYNASKFAVKGFTDALKMELSGTSINVSCVYPGGVKTNIAKNARVGKVINQDTRTRLIDEFNKLSYTTAEKAASQIIRGIKREKRRIMVGIDAKIADILVRLFPGNYEFFTRFEKRYQETIAETKASNTNYD